MGDAEREIRTKVSQTHEVQDSLPNDKEGFDGERRFIKRPKSRNGVKYDLAKKYPDGWRKQLQGADMVSDKDGVRLEVQLGNKIYRVKLEEVENG